MRRKDKEVVDVNLIESVLHEAEVCRLALADGDMPYIVPMNYAYEGQALYFHSAREGRKLDILKKNNQVCFEVESLLEVVSGETACQWSMRYLSVIGYGRAVIVDDLAEKRTALDLIMRKYAGEKQFTYPDEAVARIVVIKVEITEMTGKKSKL